MYNVREYTDRLYDMIDEGIVDGAELAKSLIYWLSEDEVRRYMEVNELIDVDDE